jgi:hypothetical protein
MLFTERHYRLPRLWPNQEIKKLGNFFTGTIVNISGWEDCNKDGNKYKNYFPKASSYSITNYTGVRGLSGSENECFLDLSADVPKDLFGKYDLCFNHTTLEHIYDVRKAFAAICTISKDAVLLVVPFSQTQHETASYGDFWRFTPTCMHYLFKENGLDVVYEAQSPYKNAGIYLVLLASCHPEYWHNVLPPFKPIRKAGSSIGETLFESIIKTIRCIYKRN